MQEAGDCYWHENTLHGLSARHGSGSTLAAKSRGSPHPPTQGVDKAISMGRVARFRPVATTRFAAAIGLSAMMSSTNPMGCSTVLVTLVQSVVGAGARQGDSHNVGQGSEQSAEVTAGTIANMKTAANIMAISFMTFFLRKIEWLIDCWIASLSLLPYSSSFLLK